jgi:hypothetical protein
VIHARGAIPRAADVPLHVGVIGEEFALVVEGDVEFIAEAGAEELHVFAIGFHAANEAAGGEAAAGMAVRIPQAGQDVVFVPNLGRTAGAEFLRQLGVIAAIEVDAFAVRAHDHAVQAVLAAALHGDELGGLVVLIVAVGVLQAVEAVFLAVLVHHDVEAVEGGEEAVGLAQLDGEFFGLQRCDGDQVERSCGRCCRIGRRR